MSSHELGIKSNGVFVFLNHGSGAITNSFFVFAVAAHQENEELAQIHPAHFDIK